MSRAALLRHTRCVEGRLYRHDPQHDDPDLETDTGQCPECEGKDCNVIRCDACDAPTANPENDYGEYICTDCEENRAEAAYERTGPTLQEQQIAAMRFK